MPISPPHARRRQYTRGIKFLGLLCVLRQGAHSFGPCPSGRNALLCVRMCPKLAPRGAKSKVPGLPWQGRLALLSGKMPQYLLLLQRNQDLACRHIVCGHYAQLRRNAQFAF